MIIFVPKGDLSKPLEDETRNPEYYEAFEQRLISAARKRVQDEMRIHELEIERKAND